MTEYTLYNKDATVMGWLVITTDGIRFVRNTPINAKSAQLIFKALKDMGND